MRWSQDSVFSSLHVTPFSTHPGGISIRVGGHEKHVNSPSTFLWKLLPKKPKFKMSVLCSNTLIFAPECWKCILRGSDFKIFPETRGKGASFFSFSISSKLLPSIKNHIENPGFGERGLLIINVYMGRPRPGV